MPWIRKKSLSDEGLPATLARSRHSLIASREKPWSSSRVVLWLISLNFLPVPLDGLFNRDLRHANLMVACVKYILPPKAYRPAPTPDQKRYFNASTICRARPVAVVIVPIRVDVLFRGILEVEGVSR